MNSIKPVPLEITESVQRFVQAGRSDAEAYDNVTFAIDDSRVYDLHRLVAEAYQKGFAAGWAVGNEEGRHRD